MLKVFKNEKLWCAVAGAAAVIVGKKILKADKTRSLAVTGLAKGMKFTHDAKEAFQNGTSVAWANDNTEVIAFALQNKGYTVGISAAEEVTE